ncbi:MAG: hypothetical protein HAW63_02835 [Bdellovibrionaceae bacterium]|nr:hypothetical protein [Pseudobdellovibrionaceae bacterium]
MADWKNIAWIKKYLSKNDFDKIENAVKQAELLTSGEIVPMVVKSSSTVGHVPIILFLLSLLLVSLARPYLELHFPSYWLLGALLFILVFTKVLSSFNSVLRFFTPKSDQSQQVLLRAQLELHTANITNTKDQTGVIIFVSLLERQVCVLADKAISQYFKKKDWQEVVNLIIKGLKNNNMAQGFEEGILKCGHLLKDKFPIQKNDINELENCLIIKE